LQEFKLKGGEKFNVLLQLYIVKYKTNNRKDSGCNCYCWRSHASLLAVEIQVAADQQPLVLSQ